MLSTDSDKLRQDYIAYLYIMPKYEPHVSLEVQLDTGLEVKGVRLLVGVVVPSFSGIDRVFQRSCCFSAGTTSQRRPFFGRSNEATTIVVRSNYSFRVATFIVVGVNAGN